MFSSGRLPEDEHRHLAFARSVQLDKKHALPSTEQNAGPPSRSSTPKAAASVPGSAHDRLAALHRSGLPFAPSCRRVDIGRRSARRLRAATGSPPTAAALLVDHDRRCRVQSLDVQDAEAQSRIGHEPLQAVGQVNEFRGLRRRETNAVGVTAGRNRGQCVHRCPPRESSAVGAGESSAIRERCVRCA